MATCPESCLVSSTSTITELEKRIDRYYEKYSSKCVMAAAVVGGGISITATCAVYFLSLNPFIATGVFCGVSLLTMNLALVFVVPPTEKLKQSRDLIVGAVRHPTRIKSTDSAKVVLADRFGEMQPLSRIEDRVWRTIILPHLIKERTLGGELPSEAKSPRKLTESERKYVDQRRKEILEMEKTLKAERERLENDRIEYEQSVAELKRAEDLVIDRLNEIERAEAELELLREVAQEASSSRAQDSSQLAEDFKQKESALRTKEAELEGLREILEKDREAVVAQQMELGERQGTMEPRAGSADADRVKVLEERIRELERASEDLEQRSLYVSDAENSLIQRLDELTLREASLEQNEVNAGLRRD